MATAAEQPETLGQWIRHWRKQRDRPLTQQALAYRAGVATTTVYMVENDRIVPREATLRRLAKALGVSPGLILDLAAEQQEAS